MAKTELQMSPQLEQIHGEIRDNFRALAYVSPHLSLPLSMYLCTTIVYTPTPSFGYNQEEVMVDIICAISILKSEIIG